jgi:hypothetical protein
MSIVECVALLMPLHQPLRQPCWLRRMRGSRMTLVKEYRQTVPNGWIYGNRGFE